MKNNKINVKKISIIVLIGIIIALILIILNMKTTNIEEKIASKEQLTETTNSNAYVDMATHLAEMENSKIDISTITQDSITSYTIDNATTYDPKTVTKTFNMTDSGTIVIFGNGYSGGGTTQLYGFSCTLNGTKVTVTKTSAVINYKSGDKITATVTVPSSAKQYTKYARISWVIL